MYKRMRWMDGVSMCECVCRREEGRMRLKLEGREGRKGRTPFVSTSSKPKTSHKRMTSIARAKIFYPNSGHRLSLCAMLMSLPSRKTNVRQGSMSLCKKSSVRRRAERI